MWPANSPDLNLVYYKIIQQKVRQSWLYNINDRRPYLLRAWLGVSESIIYDVLMRGVCVFKHVYRQMVHTLSNYYDKVYIYSAVHEKIIFVKHNGTVLSVTFLIMEKVRM